MRVEINEGVVEVVEDVWMFASNGDQSDAVFVEGVQTPEILAMVDDITRKARQLREMILAAGR